MTLYYMTNANISIRIKSAHIHLKSCPYLIFKLFYYFHIYHNILNKIQPNFLYYLFNQAAQ